MFVYISDDLLRELLSPTAATYLLPSARVGARHLLTPARNINGKLIKADIKKIVGAAYAEHKKRAKL